MIIKLIHSRNNKFREDLNFAFIARNFSFEAAMLRAEGRIKEEGGRSKNVEQHARVSTISRLYKYEMLPKFKDELSP